VLIDPVDCDVENLGGKQGLSGVILRAEKRYARCVGHPSSFEKRLFKSRRPDHIPKRRFKQIPVQQHLCDSDSAFESSEVTWALKRSEF
jgi:hypothetical protein